jgi:hypothetical protein
MVELQKMFPEEQLAKLADMTEDEMGMTHHGLGQWIRNNWDLWKGGPLADHMKSLGFTHPDDMSHSIIKEFWNRLNKRNSELEKDAAHYAEYWAKKENQ